PHRDALAVFAAGADAFIELQVVAHHAHVLERFRPVADQGGVADGARESAIFNEIAFGSRENEVAAGDVHLATAEVPAVHALRYGLDDLFGIALACEHESVGHAGHGNMGIALAPAAAGGFGFHERAGELVLQVATQHAVLDQDVALRGM